METKEFKSFYKEVKGNEGNKCHYPTRLDTYGCGCPFNCDYCYARSLLEFRGLWNPTNPSEADIEKIRRKIKRLPGGMPAIRLGGMTDCFQPKERKTHITLETLKALNEKRQPYLIVTKSNLVGEEPWLSTLDPELAHVQVTITCFDDEQYRKLHYEAAPVPSKRIQAVERLNKAGIDVQVRLSPFIPEFVDYDRLAAIDCDKLLVEFLRVNSKIEKIFHTVDFTPYTLKQGGYHHLPLDEKKKLIANIHGFKEVTVCEDESEAYEYWNHHFNPNPNDCCNLRQTSVPPLGTANGGFRKTVKANQ